VIDTVEVDYWPQAIWPTPDGKYILVANFGFDFSFDHISVIRSKDNLVIARLQTGAGPEDMVTLGEDGQYLYVSNWGMPCCFYTTSNLCCSSEVNKGTMTVIALPDFEFWVAPDSVPLVIPYIRSTLTTIPLQGEYSFGMASHPNGRFVFAVNMESNSMSVIGLKNGAITSTTSTSRVKEELSIWPNPANEQFHVSCNSDIACMRLLDLSGREVRCWRNVDKSLPLGLDGIGRGYYLVEITTQLGIVLEKLVLL
jgi:DNA-binding beta-propeller fold protein YncE